MSAIPNPQIKYPLSETNPALDKCMQEICAIAKELNKKREEIEKEFGVEVFYKYFHPKNITASLMFP